MNDAQLPERASYSAGPGWNPGRRKNSCPTFGLYDYILNSSRRAAVWGRFSICSGDSIAAGDFVAVLHATNERILLSKPGSDEGVPRIEGIELPPVTPSLEDVFTTTTGSEAHT